MKSSQRISSALVMALLTLPTVQAFVPPSQQSGLPSSLTSPNFLISTPSRRAMEPTQRLEKPMQIQHKNTRRASLLQAAPVATVAVITGAITGGIFAGGLHAIAGESFFMKIIDGLFRAMM